MYKILVMNLGSTSTKVAYYEDEKSVYSENIDHPADEIKKFATFWDQEEYRLDLIRKFLKEHNIKLEDLDAIVSRGGHTKPLVSGAYKVVPEMLEQQRSGKWGQHPADLGSKMAYSLCQGIKATALIVDPPITDEFEPVARISGHPLFKRRSSFHALSHKATAKRYAKKINKNYEDLNLIVVHLGGGISVAPHKKGKMVDGDNALEGDGTFSTNRTGALPVGDLVRLCFSGEYTYEQIHKMINGEGGLVAYLGTQNVKEVEEKSHTDEKAALILDAMIYQTCKEIGAMATVLEGKVDQILLTGGIAHSETIVAKIKERVEWIAPITVYPGENEMKSLALGALEGLKGDVPFKDFVKETEGE